MNFTLIPEIDIHIAEFLPVHLLFQLAKTNQESLDLFFYVIHKTQRFEAFEKVILRAYRNAERARYVIYHKLGLNSDYDFVGLEKLIESNKHTLNLVVLAILCLNTPLFNPDHHVLDLSEANPLFLRSNDGVRILVMLGEHLASGDSQRESLPWRNMIHYFIRYGSSLRKLALEMFEIRYLDGTTSWANRGNTGASSYLVQYHSNETSTPQIESLLANCEMHTRDYFKIVLASRQYRNIEDLTVVRATLLGTPDDFLPSIKGLIHLTGFSSLNRERDQSEGMKFIEKALCAKDWGTIYALSTMGIFYYQHSLGIPFDRRRILSSEDKTTVNLIIRRLKHQGTTSHQLQSWLSKALQYFITYRWYNNGTYSQNYITNILEHPLLDINSQERTNIVYAALRGNPDPALATGFPIKSIFDDPLSESHEDKDHIDGHDYRLKIYPKPYLWPFPTDANWDITW